MTSRSAAEERPAAAGRGRRRRWLRRHLIDVDRRHRKVYLFEILLVLQVVALHALLAYKGVALRPGVALKHSFDVSMKVQLPLFLGGCLLRFVYSALRGRARVYLRRIFTWGWMFFSVRLLIAGALTTHVYCWLKGLLQLLRPELYDQLLWQIDRWIFFGFSPNVFSLYLFRHPLALRFVDLSYGTVFFYTLAGSIPFFYSLSSDRLRVAFATGYSVLWWGGAWLYFLVPSMGPCYAFAEVWKPFAADLPFHHGLQQVLLENHQLIPLLPQGKIPPGFILATIAAFPSLHVASQTFIALWIGRLVPWLRLVFYLSAAVIFVGSVVTGWHYLIDSIAGLAIGWATFRLGVDLYSLRRVLPVRRRRLLG